MGKTEKYYQTKDFKKLNDKWTKELKKSGFEDIEQPTDFKSGAPDGNLKQWSASFFSSPSRFDLTQYQSKEEYYRQAGQFLHTHKFGSEDEQTLWEMHSEGHTLATIVGTFKARKIEYLLGRKVNNRTMHENIKRLFKIMTGKLK